MSTPSPPNTMQQPDPAPARPVRSESLLPADASADAPDQSLDVAEEVSLDQQSDSTRGIGAMPADTPPAKPAEAVAESLRPPAPGAAPPAKPPAKPP